MSASAYNFFFPPRGIFWQDYADRHGSFWTANGQWFYACNDRSHSADVAHRDVYRDTV